MAACGAWQWLPPQLSLAPHRSGHRRSPPLRERGPIARPPPALCAAAAAAAASAAAHLCVQSPPCPLCGACCACRSRSGQLVAGLCQADPHPGSATAAGRSARLCLATWRLALRIGPQGGRAARCALFMRECLAMRGHPPKPALETLVEVGSMALPKLAKMAIVLKDKYVDLWRNGDTIPSTWTCPQTTSSTRSSSAPSQKRCPRQATRRRACRAATSSPSTL